MKKVVIPPLAFSVRTSAFPVKLYNEKIPDTEEVGRDARAWLESS